MKTSKLKQIIQEEIQKDINIVTEREKKQEKYFKELEQQVYDYVKKFGKVKI